MGHRGDRIYTQRLLKDAQRFFIEGDPLMSIKFFTKYIESGRRTELAYLSRGVAYLRVNRVDDAICDFGEVINLNMRNVRAYFYRGTAFMTKEQYKEAVDDFDRTIKLKSDYGDAYLARGVVYALLGNKHEASRNMRAARKFNGSLIKSAPGTLARFDSVLDSMRHVTDPPAAGFTDDIMLSIKKSIKK